MSLLGFFDPQNSTNDPGMSMKTNESAKSHGAAQALLLNVCDAPKAQVGQVVLLVLTCPFGTSQTPDLRGLRHPSTRKPGEQSENVYENKGTAQQSTTPGLSLSKEGNSRAPLLG
jgi:hypothetical protein